MLFKEIHLKGIKSGIVTLAFRKWKRASVNNGSLLNTAIGVVKIVDINAIHESEISETDAQNAGYQNREQLLKSLKQAEKGEIYKIEVCYHSEDPRIKLSEQTQLTNEYYLDIKKKLEHLDAYSKQGHWTENILLAVRDNPHLQAIEIARQTGHEKEWLKLNIRKLKNLGLTISHSVGYELSTFGQIFVRKLLKDK